MAKLEFTLKMPANASLKPGNAPASSWTPAAATAAHRPRRRLRPRHRANKAFSALGRRWQSRMSGQRGVQVQLGSAKSARARLHHWMQSHEESTKPTPGSRKCNSNLILLNNPPFLEIPSACVKIAQRISPADGVQTILIFVEGVLMVFLGVDFWPVGVLQQNPTYGLTPFS